LITKANFENFLRKKRPEMVEELSGNVSGCAGDKKRCTNFVRDVYGNKPE